MVSGFFCGAWLVVLLLICLVVLLLWLGISRLVLNGAGFQCLCGWFLDGCLGGFVGLLLSGVGLLLVI